MKTLKRQKEIRYYFSFKVYCKDRKVDTIGTGTYVCSHGFKLPENYDEFYAGIIEEYELDKNVTLDLTISRL